MEDKNNIVQTKEVGRYGDYRVFEMLMKKERKISFAIFKNDKQIGGLAPHRTALDKAKELDLKDRTSK